MTIPAQEPPPMAIIRTEYEFGQWGLDEVHPEEVGAKTCARLDCEFSWFRTEEFPQCPACELRELREKNS